MPRLSERGRLDCHWLVCQPAAAAAAARARSYSSLERGTLASERRVGGERASGSVAALAVARLPTQVRTRRGVLGVARGFNSQRGSGARVCACVSPQARPRLLGNPSAFERAVEVGAHMSS